MRTLLLTIFLAAFSFCEGQTLKSEMQRLHQERGLSFIYDATLPVDASYRGPSLGGLPVSDALNNLFAGSGISYQQRGTYVLLFATTDETPAIDQRKVTLSGTVRDSVGETVIGAAIYDLTTNQGTITNEHGFYSLTLPSGPHLLRLSHVGYTDEVRSLRLQNNRREDFTLRQNHVLGEVIIEGEGRGLSAFGRQMGRQSLTQDDIKTEFSLLSSPDVVKTLQRLAGVQDGIELASGLYVHGGNNDENLFLLDGTPLYQINHSLGLFSAFNADVVKNVDFYKSGFPARYGGRLSSVVDVRTMDGNMQEWHGAYRIGLIDGGVNIEGPLHRGTTSLSVALRRSWLDLLTTPIMLSFNSDEEKLKLNYAFHDLNAKVTHLFSPTSRLSLSLYSGLDALHTSDDWREKDDNYLSFRSIYENRFSWGNINASLAWQVQLSPQLMGSFTAIYTHNRSHFRTKEDDRSFDQSGRLTDRVYDRHLFRSTINDAGYRTEFDYRPSPTHHIRFGHDYTLHHFRPQTTSRINLWTTGDSPDTLRRNSLRHDQAHELTLYGEDLTTIGERWNVWWGANLSLFSIGKKQFVAVDPRLTVSYQLAENTSLKATYTRMTQYVHKVTNSFLELPTDYWVPTTERLHPMHSHQVAAGIYWHHKKVVDLALEGYYKESRHLLQYSSWAGLEPPAANWDTQVNDGRGRYYGMELTANYHAQHLEAGLVYTLSWNKRRFNDFYSHWYYDKFDNRHKLLATLRYRFNPKTQVYAAWTCRTGNRMTFPTQYMLLPSLPNGTPQRDAEAEFVYEKPNDMVLPTYHRLDVGFNFRHTTKHGHERIWNLSVYNAYCHLNTLWTDIKYRPLDSGKVNLAGQRTFRLRSRAFIPIIPSCSYTIKF